MTVGCDCREDQCYGNGDFCRQFKCGNASGDCKCELTNEQSILKHVSDQGVILHPLLLTFDICLNAGRQLNRKLLENEFAEFSRGTLNFTFRDPVLRFNTQGTVILRSTDYEHVLNVTDSLEIVLPFEMLAHKTTLTIIFISTQGNTVQGNIQILGKTLCSLHNNCVLCRQALRSVRCLPPIIQYIVYGLLAIFTLIILWFARLFCDLLHWMIMGSKTIVRLIWRILKTLARFCLLLGNHAGTKIRSAIRATNDYLEQKGEMQRLNIAIVAKLLIAVVPRAEATCSDFSVIASDGTTSHITLRDVIYTSSGIKIRILGAYDQGSLHLKESFVQRVGNPNEAYLTEACIKNVPKAGLVGSVQANTSYSKNFIFDKQLSSCDFYESQLRCQTSEDAIAKMAATKENALPLTRDLHNFKADKHGLKSTLLSSAAIRIQLQFTDYDIELEAKSICPKIDTEFTILGCYDCNVLAHMSAKAHSACGAGLVEVQLQEINVHTKAILLSTEPETLTVKFLAQKQCYTEKLCLRSQNMIQCVNLEFCLDEPSIELRQLNFNYTRSVSQTSSANIYDWLHFPSLNSAFFVFKFAGAVMICLGLTLTIGSTLISCCCRR